jgi:hypothetical protein
MAPLLPAIVDARVAVLREPASTGGVVLAFFLAPPNLFHARWSKICACNAVKDGFS